MSERIISEFEYDKLEIENTRLLRRVAELEAALRNLRNELGGCWRVYEDYLREAMGHTNYNCVAERLSQADAVLAPGSAGRQG